MHELSIAQNILDIVRQSLPAGETRRVLSVKLKIGDLAGVVTDSLEFCFAAITADTSLDGTRLDIEHVPVLAECKNCGERSAVEDHTFACPSCRSGNLAIVTGRELQVTEIELFDEPPESP
jgi:hydrogenase nickel incorporation protein HypA/HybF